MISRRGAVLSLAALACPGAAGAHTLYGQWVVYRQRRLLIGCHREEPATYDLALGLVDEINGHLPEAQATVARAPHPERLASLLGTDQMDLAVLLASDAQGMIDGAGKFAPYGRIALQGLAGFGILGLYAHARFPDRHAWLIRSALDAAAEAPDGAPMHAGASLYLDGAPLPTD